MKDLLLAFLVLLMMFFVIMLASSDVEVMWDNTPHHFLHIKLMP